MNTRIPEATLVNIRARGITESSSSRFVDPAVLYRCTKVLAERGEQWAASVLGRDISARSRLVPSAPALRAGEEYALVLADTAEDDAALKKLAH